MYYVWVCPHCQTNAQITRITRTNQKTTVCQRCGKRLNIRKIRILGSFEKRDDAVTARSALHAQVTGPCRPIEEGSLFSSMVLEKKQKIKIERETKKKTDKIIADILEKNGPIESIELQKLCSDAGISKETYTEIISKMIRAGMIYVPKKNVYDIVR